MSKKKHEEEGSAAEMLIDQILSHLSEMSEEERKIAMQMLIGTSDEDSNDPEYLNSRYYKYEGPEVYNKGSKRVPKWLKEMWDAYDYDSWLQLCQDTDEKGKELNDEKRSQDIRKYLYMLIDEFYYCQYPEPNPIRLIGPLWLIEKHQLTDCLGLILELLRQDAWFYTAYIDHAPQCLSAVLYQIGKDEPKKLIDILYEDGLIPLIKPIVFNALIWITLRQPQNRLGVIAMLTAYLNHCLKICKKGASARNVPIYGRALAYAHINEARPILKRLFTEVKTLDMEVFQEIKRIYDDPTDHLEGFLFDSIDGYLNHQEEQDGNWDYDEEDYYDDEEEEEILETDLYDRRKEQKRYTIRVELTDAPELVERTLQVPSNIRLKALAQLIMVAFGRQEEPTEYLYQTKDNLYPDSSCHSFTLGDMLKRKNQSALFIIYNKKNDTHWKHGIVLEKSADYSERTTNYITLLDGRGTYPSASIPDMDTYLLRFMDGKLKKPNFKTVREHIREFEENYNLPL
jgi:hypothetical protein